MDVVESILTNGFFPRYCLEDISWLPAEKHAYPMACFCDIPLSRIADHTATYGTFGIGLTREWAVANGLEPVIYAVPGGAVANGLKRFLDAGHSLLSIRDQPLAEKYLKDMIRLFQFVKPTEGLIDPSSLETKQFYQENEWRFVPVNTSGVAEHEYKLHRDALNTVAESDALRFALKDIRYIFVDTEAVIPKLAAFVESMVSKYSQPDIHLLLTRITSVETIARDL